VNIPAKRIDGLANHRLQHDAKHTTAGTPSDV
jgi:hypothetical protein